MSDILRHANANTVEARNQIRGERFFGDGAVGRPRVLFVGNSITIHESKPEIGWNADWGMAASAEEKDYVHVLTEMLRKVNPAVEAARINCADWERAFWTREEAMTNAAGAREWDADVVVIRLTENTLLQELEGRDYAAELAWLMDYFNPNGRAKFVVTDGFWPNPEKDLAAYRAAQMRNAAFVSLTDLGQRDDMKAIGLFEHSGVAGHPGDKGMREIAERLFAVVKHMV